MNLLTLIKDKSYSDIHTLLTSEEYGLSVRHYDDLGLYRIAHKISDDTDFTEATDEVKAVRRECNGVILDKKTNKLVCYGMDKIPEFQVYVGTQETTELSDNLFPFQDDYDTEYTVDGSIIKVYYWKDTWYVGTNRTPDASRAKWHSNKSFRELFDEAAKHLGLTLNNETLKTGHTYTFILQHPENRIVKECQVTDIIHIATRNMETLQEVDLDIKLNNGNIMSNPKKCLKIHRIELLSFLKTLDYNIEGVVIKSHSTGERLKLKGPGYTKIHNLKGNTPNVKFRYLQLFETSEVAEFLKYYPEYETVFDKIDIDIKRFATKLHRNYLDHFVHKQIYPEGHPKRINKKYMQFLWNLHNDYLNSKGKKPTTYDHVHKSLTRLPIKVLAYMMELGAH